MLLPNLVHQVSTVKRLLKLLVLSSLLSVISFTACNSIKLSTDYDNTIDFTSYKKYAWHPDALGDRSVLSDGTTVTPRLGKLIRIEIDRQLTKKGYTLVELSQAELLINWQGALSDHRAPVDISNKGAGSQGFDFQPSIGDPDYVSTQVSQQVSDYRRGTLIVEMQDAKTKTVVWKGKAKGVIDDYADSEENLFRFLTPILKDFPPNS